MGHYLEGGGTLIIPATLRKEEIKNFILQLILNIIIPFCSLI